MLVLFLLLEIMNNATINIHLRGSAFVLSNCLFVVFDISVMTFELLRSGYCFDYLLSPISVPYTEGAQ